MESTKLKTVRSRKSNPHNSAALRRPVTLDDIRMRAYEIYMDNIEVPHDALEDWLKAERELKDCRI